MQTKQALLSKKENKTRVRIASTIKANVNFYSLHPRLIDICDSTPAKKLIKNGLGRITYGLTVL